MRPLVAGSLVVATLALIAAGALRMSAVQDRLFDLALEKAMEPSTALFDGDGLKVFFCGTGSPLPSRRRAQTCTAIIAGDRFFLVDAGTGSWENIQAAGISGGRLGAIFLTHLHSDHIGDLSEANLGSWVGGRLSPLSVYGPMGVQRVVAGENEAFSPDNGYRTAHHGENVAPPATAGMVAAPFTSGVVYEADGLKVTAFLVGHAPVTGAVGFRFDHMGRSVVISGDTSYSENLVENAKGADLLIHEAQANHMVVKMHKTAAAAGAKNTAQIFADIQSYHTTPEEAAHAANQASVGWLLLTHLTPAPDNIVAKSVFMRGVANIRQRNVRLAEDGMLVSLPAAGGVDFDRLLR